jgi:transcription elongation factor SPT5
MYDDQLKSVLRRIKVVIRGTHQDNYLEGNYENRTGRILGAIKTGVGIESSATIQLNPPPNDPDDSETRPILTKYIQAVLPENQDDQAVILHGPKRGQVVRVRQQPDDGEFITISPLGSAIIDEVRKESVAALYEDI